MQSFRFFCPSCWQLVYWSPVCAQSISKSTDRTGAVGVIGNSFSLGGAPSNVQERLKSSQALAIQKESRRCAIATVQRLRELSTLRW